MCVINIVLIGVVIGLVLTRNSDDDDYGTRRKTSSYSLEKDNESEMKDQNDEKTVKEENKGSADMPEVNQNANLLDGLDKSKPQAMLAYYLNASYEFDKLEEECVLFKSPKMLNKLEAQGSSDHESSVVAWDIVNCKEYSYGKDVTEGIKAYIEYSALGNSSYVEESAIIELKPTEYRDDETPYRVYVTLCKIGNEWYIVNSTKKEPDKINRVANDWAEMARGKHLDD